MILLPHVPFGATIGFVKRSVLGRLLRAVRALALPVAFVGAWLVVVFRRKVDDADRAEPDASREDDLSESESSWVEWRGRPLVLVQS